MITRCCFARHKTLRRIASGDAYGGEENPALQTGKSGHVRLGNTRPVAVAAHLRSEHDSVGELGEPDPTQRRLVDGRHEQR